MLKIAFAKPALPKSGALVLLVCEGEQPSGLWAQIDEASGGAITRAFRVAEFRGAKGKNCSILAPGSELTRVLAVGLGKASELCRKTLEEAGGAISLELAREPSALVAADNLSGAQGAQVASGAVLRAYRFDRYRTKEEPDNKPKLVELTILTGDIPRAKSAWEHLAAVAMGVFITRDLVNEPANILNPVEMADRCRKLTELGVKIEILGPGEMAKLGFGALLGVAQGSANEPRMVVMHWSGAQTGARRTKDLRDKPVIFVGKGVTFDTGGISIKPAAGMEDMKWDMAGAGTVAGVMATLACRKAKVNAIGLLGLVENMPSHSAQRPGDVVASYSGQTIEVINTDAEGRLVLCDVMWYAQQKYDPRVIIDLATLTGAIVISLGHECAGLFSNNDELSLRLHQSGLEIGEHVWRMPLSEAYDKQLRSDIADMKNVGGRPGGAITAAQFLQRFVSNNRPWAHLDIAGMAWSSKDSATTPKGATAFGVRLLDQLVAEYYES